MTEILFRWVEFLPLVAFLAAGKALDTPTAGPHWRGPFLLGGGLAVLATVLPLWRRLRLNRLALGINLYLIVGAAAFLLQLGWLLRLYGRWQAAGMLAAVVAVGVVTLLWSPQGFIGVAQADRQAIRTYSLYLLLIAVGAFLGAWAFHARPVLSMALPFTALFMGYKLLRAHLTARTGEHPIQATAPPGPMPSSGESTLLIAEGMVQHGPQPLMWCSRSRRKPMSFMNSPPVSRPPLHLCGRPGVRRHDAVPPDRPRRRPDPAGPDALEPAQQCRQV